MRNFFKNRRRQRRKGSAGFHDHTAAASLPRPGAILLPATEAAKNKKRKRRRTLRRIFAAAVSAGIGIYTYLHTKTAAAFLLASVVYPTATWLLPRAGGELEKRGVPSALVETLAPGKTIFVRNNSLMSRFHLAISYPNPMDQASIFASSGYRQYDINAFAKRDLSYPTDTSHLLPPEAEWSAFLLPSDGCLVMFGGNLDNMDVRDFIFSYAHPLLSLEKIQSRFNITNADLAAQTLMHEFRHCSQYQRDIEDTKGIYSEDAKALLQEADSEYRSIRALAESKPLLAESLEVIAFFSHINGINVTQEHHDVALILNAQFNGTETPSPELALIANKEAYRFIHNDKERPAAYRKLSPLAKERVRLYREAKTFFTAPRAERAEEPLYLLSPRQPLW